MSRLSQTNIHLSPEIPEIIELNNQLYTKTMELLNVVSEIYKNKPEISKEDIVEILGSKHSQLIEDLHKIHILNDEKRFGLAYNEKLKDVKQNALNLISLLLP